MMDIEGIMMMESIAFMTHFLFFFFVFSFSEYRETEKKKKVVVGIGRELVVDLYESFYGFQSHRERVCFESVKFEQN